MTAKRAVRHRQVVERVAGANPVCPKCGGPIRCTTDPFGYGVTVEQCARGFPACDHFRTLSRRVRPELARRPSAPDTKRVRRSPGLGGPRPPRAARRPTAGEVRLRVLHTLPIDAETAETLPQLAARLRVSVGFVKRVLTALEAEGCATSRPHHIAGKTGRPAHVWWRCA